MATDSAEALRAELDELGRERKAQEAGDEERAKRIRDAVARAKGKIPASEIADRLQMHRTTFYRVYRKKR